MRIGCDKFAKRLLERCGCSDDCYRGIDVKEIEKDLTECFAEYPNYNYNNYPIHDIAICLRQIGDAVPPPPPKMWRVVWDGDNFIDGRECETFEEAQSDALDTMVNWTVGQLTEMGVNSYDNWSEEQIEDWDYMIYNCGCWVEKRDANNEDDWAEYWYPSEEEYREIGWLLYDELHKAYS